MFDRFTGAAREAVVRAQEECRDLNDDHIGAQHLLLGAVAEPAGIPARVLADLGIDSGALRGAVAAMGVGDAEALSSLGIDLDAVRRAADQTFGPGALDRPRRQRRGLFGRRGGGHLPFDDEATSSLQLALEAATSEHHGYIGTEHVLLGLLATKRGTCAMLLDRLGVTETVAEIRHRVLAMVPRAA